MPRPPYPNGPQFTVFDRRLPLPEGVWRVVDLATSVAAATEHVDRLNAGSVDPSDWFWTPRSQWPDPGTPQGAQLSGWGIADTLGPLPGPYGDIRPGQIVDIGRLLEAGPDVYDGLIVTNNTDRPVQGWQTGMTYRLSVYTGNRSYVSYSRLVNSDDWEGPDDGRRNQWGNGRLLVLHVPLRETEMPTAPPADGRPHCPLCFRWAAHVVAGQRHRTTPSGSVWCRGSDVAGHLSNLFNTVMCLRCETAQWPASMGTHSTVDGTVTACRACRDTLGRLYTQGAQPHELRFGVELETESLRYDREAAEIAREKEVDQTRSITMMGDERQKKVKARIGKGWSAKADGSLRGPIDRASGHHRNAEVISPPMYFTPASLLEVQAVTRELRYKGARHAERCGLHVHVGCENLSVVHVRQLCQWWYAVQRTVIAALPIWSYRQRFCVLMDSRTAADSQSVAFRDKVGLATLRGNERYNALNLSALRKHGTVEFRFFNGSVHAAKVSAYIEFAVRLVSHASRNPMPPNTAFTSTRAGMHAVLDALGFEQGRTSQRWHLLGAFASEADRPGPPGASALDPAPVLRSPVPTTVQEEPADDHDDLYPEDDDDEF